MNVHVFKQATQVNKPIKEVFDFFCKAENLNLITPPSLHFEILSKSPVHIQQGAVIDYRIKLGLLAFNWQSIIEEWNPPYLFKDVQLKGPYKIWEHRHSFTEVNGITVMTDEVKYLSPGLFLEPLIDKFFVRKKIEEIFRYRQYKLEVFFGQ